MVVVDFLLYFLQLCFWHKFRVTPPLEGVTQIVIGPMLYGLLLAYTAAARLATHTIPRIESPGAQWAEICHVSFDPIDSLLNVFVVHV